ncbi:hypothetical protein Glove_681g14 [Diversispora epigaea]|uniref:Uncharacterized protein n=1 Tax=Diversispora epigaea TaxID=1348612 RepID=A0A397G2Q9_9GLOM|nr:hypothetical protein Glove_681g14 [Diversispora epigaea]
MDELDFRLGPVDFAIDSRTADVTEVKHEDFYKGVAQNSVQSSQTKYQELLKPILVAYKNGNMESMVEKFLGHIVIKIGTIRWKVYKRSSELRLNLSFVL